MPQALQSQGFAQLRLSDENGLQQQLLAGVDVGEYAQLFERGKAQILGLIDDQYGAAAARVLLFDVADEAAIRLAGCRLPQFQSKRFQDPGQQVAKAGMGVGDETDVARTVGPLQEVAYDGRLAAAHFSRDERKTGGL